MPWVLGDGHYKGFARVTLGVHVDETLLWKARWDPQVMIYIFHCFIPDDPGSDLGHSMIVIMTGQLIKHDRPMFAIIAGTTYIQAISCYQSLQGQLIPWPSHVYNMSILCYNHGHVKLFNLIPQGF